MSTRFKKYFGKCKSNSSKKSKAVCKERKQENFGLCSSCCKGIDCNGRSGKHCPSDRPRNEQNGSYRRCGRWVVELNDENQKWQSLVFKDVRSKADAERRLSLLIADRERGKLSLPSKKVIPTFAVYSEKYLSLAKGEKENTFIQKKRAVKALSKVFGDYQLDKITPFMVKKYRVEKQEKEGLKPRTINLDVAILKHILNMAIEDNILESNPCAGLKQLKVDQGRDRILSDDEIKLLMDTLQGKDKLMVLTSLLTGMRLGEVINLKWADIDFNNNIISFTQFKTGKLINMPLSTYLKDEMILYKDSNNSERLFDDRPVNHNLVNSYSYHFSQLFKDLGIHGFTYHSLRHTFASLQCSTGTDIITTQGLLGHSSVVMTMRYSHSQDKTKKDAIDNITNHICNAGMKEAVSGG
ncbi:MAG: tyrosine-type recombinase/integrase [Candidatus Anammoxibacter sp.]